MGLFGNGPRIGVGVRVLCIDPGAKPGFCLTDDGSYQWVDWREPPQGVLDELVIEDQFAAAHLYRNGKKVRVRRASQMALSFTAGMLFERFPATRKYRIGADAWRRILWPGSVRLTKPVVLARLEPEYGALVADVPKTHRADVLEAVGISAAWARLSQTQKEQYRCG